MAAAVIIAETRWPRFQQRGQRELTIAVHVHTYGMAGVRHKEKAKEVCSVALEV
jgi:hypothetical protein